MGLAHVSLYPEIRSLKISKAVSLFLGWAVMAFELAIISLPFFPDYAGIYFVLAIVFHLVVFASFGLNRFFWIWMCAWPSIFFALTQIK
jgi:hypothetical protein